MAPIARKGHAKVAHAVGCRCDVVATQVTNETLVAIFQTILTWHLSSGGFPQGCQQLGPGIIAATLEMYSQSIAKLLPTPTKSHYTFNLRDFARVIQVGTLYHIS